MEELEDDVLLELLELDDELEVIVVLELLELDELLDELDELLELDAGKVVEGVLVYPSNASSPSNQTCSSIVSVHTSSPLNWIQNSCSDSCACASV